MKATMQEGGRTGKKEPPFTSRYVYQLDDSVLKSLRLMYFDSLTHEERSEQEYKKSLNSIVSNYNDGTVKGSFERPKIVKPRARSSAKKHVESNNSSDLDKYNEKRARNGQKLLTETEFEAKMDQLSISGSETEDELDTIREEESLNTKVTDEADNSLDESSISYMFTKSPFVLFHSGLLQDGKCFGVYKTTLDAEEGKSDPMRKLLELNSEKFQQKLDNSISALFMIGGGHFAGAIINHKPIVTKGNKGSPEELQLQSVNIAEHKTFHRYTTRRKQGGSQSTSDNARGKANSAGSTLRRYNEQALREEVQDLLKSWKPLLDRCDRIFIKANGVYARQSLLGKGPEAVIEAEDPRVRIFPFTTKRPTTKELRRAWCELSYLKVMDIPKSDKKAVEMKMRQREHLAKSKEQKQKKIDVFKSSSEDDETTKQLISLVKKSKAPSLIAYIRKNKVPVNFRLLPEKEYGRNTQTMLHYAAHFGLGRMCQVLLVNLKADPTIKNERGYTAYEMSADEKTKYAFEVARNTLGEDYCDWEKAAKVPGSKSREEVEEILKKKEDESREKLRELHEKELETARKQFSESHDKKFGRGKTLGGFKETEQHKLDSLTPQQKMRVMREQRARAIEARMKANK